MLSPDIVHETSVCLTANFLSLGVDGMKRHLRLDISHHALYPDVAELLRRLPPEILHHSRYPFRHPAAVYQLSLRQLANDFKRVLTDCTALRSDVSRADVAEQLAQSQRILIYSLREHLDDCQMILMCMVDPATVASQGSSPDEFLRAAGLPERKVFWDSVHNYSDTYLMPLVNKLKHSQGRFRIVRFDCSPSDIRLGFYLEEMDEKEAAQPSVKLHGGNSAFSYARDIRRNLGSVFRAAGGLHGAVEAFLKRLGRSHLAAPEGAEIIEGAWTEVCRNVAAFDSGVFPQELKDPFVRFSLNDEGKLKIREMEKDLLLSFPDGNVRCSTQISGDGMTKSYRMPYAFGNKPQLR